MTPAQRDRIGAGAAVSFIVLSVIGIVVATKPPSSTASPDTLVGYFTEHRTGVLWSSVLLAVAVMAFFVYLGSLRSRLARSEDADSFGSSILYAAGITVAGLALLGSVTTATLAYRPALTGTSGTQVLFDLNNMVNVFVSFAASVVAVSAGASALVRKSFPAWLGWLGIAAGVAAFVGGFEVFGRSGSFAPGGTSGFYYFAGFLLWMLGTAVVLAQSPSQPRSIDLTTGDTRSTATATERSHQQV